MTASPRRRQRPIRVLLLAALLSASCSDPAVERGPVTVTVLSNGPVAGAEVYFHDPDGVEVAHLFTDARGKSTAVLARGGSVTVARIQLVGSLDFAAIDTIAELAPGDEPVLDSSSDLLGGGLAGQARVTFPGPFEGAIQYSAQLGCNGTDWSGSVEPATAFLLTTCGSTLDAIALASDGQGPVAWSAVTDVPITGSVPDQSATVDFGPWRSDLGILVVEATNPPAGGRVLNASLTPRRHGRRYVQATSAAGASLSAPQTTRLTLAYAQDFWTSADFMFRLSTDTWSGGLAVNEASIAPWHLDLSQDIPPPFSGLSVETTGGGTAVRWLQAAPDLGLDGTLLLAGWNGPRGLLVWSVSLPPGRGSFQFPSLPAALATWGPGPGAAFDVLGVVGYDVGAATTFRGLGTAYGVLVAGGQLQGPGSLRWSASAFPR